MTQTKLIPFLFALSSFLWLLVAPGAILGQATMPWPCREGRLSLSDDYSAKDAKTDFQVAHNLSEADSLWKKAGLFYHVVLFDSTSHIGRLAKAEWSRLKATYLSKISEAILGEWQWVWSGSIGYGRGETPKSCECTQKIVVSKDSIAYYRDGQLEKTTAYQIHVVDWTIGSHWFQIQLEDQCQSVSIDPKSCDLFAPDPAPGTEFLNINQFSGCVCGCPHDSYERKR